MALKSLTFWFPGQVVAGASAPAYRLDGEYDLASVWLRVTSAPVARNIIVDIKVNGVSVFDGTTLASLSQNNTDDVYETFTFVPPVIQRGSVITCEVVQAGKYSPGYNLTVQLDLEPVGGVSLDEPAYEVTSDVTP